MRRDGSYGLRLVSSQRRRSRADSTLLLRRFTIHLVALLVVAAGATSAIAQKKNALPPQAAKMPIDQAAKVMEADPAMKAMRKDQRISVLEFVAGNLVFVLQHEMGHAQISERKLPVLGARDEDAADVFATLTMLEMGDVMSYRVLEHAAMGWFLSAKRGERSKAMLEFYQAHGLDRQRAYQVVCLMVGSDAKKFKALADGSKLPEDRRESCGADYRFAKRSWDGLLDPYRRKPDAPRTEVKIVYDEAKGGLAKFAEAAKAARLLENLGEYATDQFVWSEPFAMQMTSCGESNASWDPFTRKITLCYEMAQELAELYMQHDSGMKRTAARRGR